MCLRLVHVTTIPETLRFLDGHVDYLIQNGVEVHAVSSPGVALNRFVAQHHIQAHEVAMRRAIAPLHDLVSLLRLTWLFYRIRPQIVHSHTPKGGFLGMICGWLARTNVRVYHVHGVRLETTTGYRRVILRWSELVACCLAHEVMCVSHSARELMIDLKLCPREKIRLLVNGSISGVDAAGVFNPARFSAAERAATRATCGIPDDAFIIGFVGRIAADKGIAELAEAWANIRDAFPTAQLLLAGRLDEADPVPGAVRARLERDQRVHLVGFAEDIASLYSIMDLVVLPSYREGFGMALLEAAAMGLPTVASRVVGCVDAVVDGVTGTLVAARDADALANAIGAYVRSSDLRVRRGQAGRDRALRDFRPNDIWKALFAAYDALLKDAAKK